jgi:hypothetical protein
MGVQCQFVGADNYASRRGEQAAAYVARSTPINQLSVMQLTAAGSGAGVELSQLTSAMEMLDISSLANRDAHQSDRHQPQPSQE